MPRGRPPLPWVKLHSSFLVSSINYEMSLAQQAIFIKILIFSANCGSKAGHLIDNDGRPIPLRHIADCIHAPLKMVVETMDIGLKTNRYNENGSGCLEVANYDYYQSEYARQKPYREAKRQRDEDPDKYVQGKLGHVMKR